MSIGGYQQQSVAAVGKTLVLASQSPRRLQLLRQTGFDPVCLPVDVDETPLADESAEKLVARLAGMKATACEQHSGFLELKQAGQHLVVLAADTVIELDERILGKPADEQQGLSMLQSLSNREHRVLSGVCVRELASEPQTLVVSSSVKFTTISPERARRYWLSGEPQGKAGCYAIQGIGAQFVVHLSGSYSNVVGLPLFETSRLLESAGLTSF